MEEKIDQSESAQERGMRAALPTSYATYVDRWAIVVGISQYKHQSMNLKYADRDAEALYELLLTPSGGGFEKDHIVKLTNDEATTANITRSLRSFLKKPAKDDIVLLYFAGHGAPDIDRPGILYLLTYDTDPTDISGTALPMREINLSLRENLLAERIIMIADTCHSAGLSREGIRDAGDSSGAINLYLKEVGSAKKGLALLTSAESNQVSFEHEKWGGGHGVFTHFLLEGMRGAADRNPHNGIVTVGELFEYVREKVKEATNHQQHPCVGTNAFDRNLPIAITAGISAHEHYELGCQLYQVGMKLNDRGQLQSGIRHLSEAIRLARITGLNFIEAQLQLGLVLMNLGELGKAIEVFKAAKADLPDTAYHLGIAYAKQGESEKSVQVLESFLKQYPQDERATWIREFIVQQMRQYVGTKYLLLIGIDDQPPESGFPRPTGCLNDVQLIRDLLVEQFAFLPENISTLTDGNATCSKILLTLQQLAHKATSNDIVVIHFSGQAIEPAKYKHYLIAHDSVTPYNTFTKEIDESRRDIPFLRTITAQQLHDCINVISGNKTLILDTHANQNFIDLAGQGNYTLLLGTSPGIPPYERTIDEKRYGFFTYSLVEQLRQLTANVKLGQLQELVTDRIQSLGGNQLPVFIGDREEYFFTNHNYLLDFFDFSQRRNFSAFTAEQLEQQYETATKRLTVPFPEFYQSLGQAFLEKGNYEKAVSSFQIALEQSQQNHFSLLFAMGTAQVLAGQYAAAHDTFQKYLNLDHSQNHAAHIHKVLSELEQLRFSKRCALLIGVDRYLDSTVPNLQGAVNDVLALKQVLIEKHHFQEADIKLLLNEDATRETILECFAELIESSKDTPALFYFAGNGSLTDDDSLTILGVDSRQNDIYDIELNELAEAVGKQFTNLTTIIDAGWANAIAKPTGERVALPDSRSRPKRRAMIPTSAGSTTRTPSEGGLIHIRDLSSIDLQIGFLSIYTKSIEFGLYESGSEIQGEKDFGQADDAQKNIHGTLTYALLKSLRSTKADTFTYAELVKSVSEQLGSEPFVVGTDVTTQLFKDVFKESSICDTLKQIEQESLRQTTLILERLIEQRNGFDPEGALNLGIIRYILGEPGKSLAALESAIAQISEHQSRTAEQRSEDYPEIHYWLGRSLYESNRDPARAVSGLRLATQQDPTNIPAHYYLGLALRSLVKQEFMSEAEQAFHTYLKSGAPLGHRRELQEFLKERSSVKKQNQKNDTGAAGD